MQKQPRTRSKLTFTKGQSSAVQQQPGSRKSQSGNDLSIIGGQVKVQSRLSQRSTVSQRRVLPLNPSAVSFRGEESTLRPFSRLTRTRPGNQTKKIEVSGKPSSKNQFFRPGAPTHSPCNTFSGHLHNTDFKLNKDKQKPKPPVKLRKRQGVVSETKTSFKNQKAPYPGNKLNDFSQVHQRSTSRSRADFDSSTNFYDARYGIPISKTKSSSRIPLCLTSVSAPKESLGSGYRFYNSSSSRLVGTGSGIGGGGAGDSTVTDPISMLTEDMSSKTDLSLGEQKKLQWAKERDEAGGGGGPGEEQNGLWSPWGRPSGDSKSTSAIYGSQPSNAVPASYVTKLGLQSQAAVSYSQSDCYLPPINATLALAQQSHSHQLQHQKSTTWAITNKDDNYNNNNNNESNNRLISRKSSLPNFSHGDGYHHTHSRDREGHSGQMTQSYHNELNNMEGGGARTGSGVFFSNKSNGWSSLEEPEVGYHTSGYQSENNNNEYQLQQHQLNNTDSEELSHRKIDGDGGHFIFSDQSNRGFPMSSNGNRSPRVIMHKIVMDPPNSGHMNSRGDAEYLINTMSNNAHPSSQNSYANLEEMKRSYGGSTGYLSSNHPKPPPVAMRSSLTIGLDSPFANSYGEIEKKEKEQWLNELEKQREEQRLRKLMEKEDKRARWGDRGIGVGHFWEPTDSLTARLPPTSNSRDGRDRDGMTQGSPTPPAWLERSLTLQMQNSKSQPNLQQELQIISNEMNSNLFVNQSSVDLRNSAGISQETGDNSDRTFIRGQNVPIDPNLVAEKEKKRQTNQEHLEAIKQQIEERQRKLKEERQRQLEEDKEQEQRMAHQRELELKRLDMEKRKRSCRSDDLNDEVSNISGDIHKSGQPSQTFQWKRNQESSDEPPLIPHQMVHNPDAYELEIARRQSILLSSSASETQKTNCSTSQSDLREDLTSAKSIKTDQCLMTDSDHLYERTLTPTKVRSHSQGRQREFGTQTELSDTGLTSDKSSAKSRSHNSLSDGKSKSKDGHTSTNSKKKVEEKPRWGSNPVKKQYLKQSEKDPNYQQKMKRRQERQTYVDGETCTDESEDQNIPFPRIRSRIKSKSPTKAKTQQGPLKALHLKTEMNQKSRSKDTSKQKQKPQERSTMKKNFKSDPHLNKDNSSLNTIVRRNLGSIGGLNSAGTSEESHSGSGFTSPSLFQRNTISGSGTTGSASLVSQTSPEIPEYIPSFSSEFVLQRDFDELPINAGKIAPGFQKVFCPGMSESLEKVEIEKSTKVERVTQHETQLKTKKQVSSSTVTSAVIKQRPQKVPKTNPRNPPTPTIQPNRQTDLDDHEEFLPEISSQPLQSQRISSPPVPALLKKMQMGFHADESGRVSSLPPEHLSPIPNVPIGSSSGSRLNTPILNNTSRMSSAAPKIDIDIAVCSASNPDLQRILEESEGQRGTTTAGDDTDSSADYKRFKLPYIAPDIISSRSNRESIISRPGTKGSELSMQIQEDFILDLMSQREVQEQLSARESELSEKGIIEFNIRLPSSWAKTNGGRSSGASGKIRSTDEYQDPLISERRKATADWLKRMDDNPREAILTNLSSLKQGIRLQQKELDFHQIRPMAYAISTDDE